MKMNINYVRKKLAKVWAKILTHKLIAICSLIGILALGLIVWMSSMRAMGWVWADWTGFGPNLDADGKLQPGKRLWDWLELLIIPVFLAIIAIIFNWQERKNEMRVALKVEEERRKSEIELSENRNQEAVLQNYFDRMNELLLNGHFLEVMGDQKEPIYIPLHDETQDDFEKDLTPPQRAVLNMAQVRTITALRQLNTYRRNIVLQFLRDAKLDKFVLAYASFNKIDLRDADMMGFNLHRAKLDGSNLERALLNGANLTGADLSSANLSGAYLMSTDMSDAQLFLTDLSGAFMMCANLNRAAVISADLSHAKLTDVSLGGTRLNGSDLTGAVLDDLQLERAQKPDDLILPDGKKYDPRIHQYW